MRGERIWQGGDGSEPVKLGPVAQFQAIAAERGRARLQTAPALREGSHEQVRHQATG
jgi:hypothetical protein